MLSSLTPPTQTPVNRPPHLPARPHLQLRRALRDIAVQSGSVRGGAELVVQYPGAGERE